jgi:protein archease
LKRSSYRFIPDIALADVAFAAWGDSPASLFEACAAALTEVMVDRRTLRRTEKRDIEVKADDRDGLLYDFLTQLIVLKDVDSLLFKTFRARVTRDGRGIRCTVEGEQINRARHRLRNDVKAVTMYMFGVRHENARWKATVVLDI